MNPSDSRICAQDLVELLHLEPHPEGGWYREIHRSADILATPRGPRAALTSIYFLLERSQFSRWHAVASDETWHFAYGAPLELLVYSPDSRQLRRELVGPPHGAGDCFAALFLGHYLKSRSVEAALARAVSGIHAVLTASAAAGAAELRIVAAQDQLDPAIPLFQPTRVR